MRVERLKKVENRKFNPSKSRGIGLKRVESPLRTQPFNPPGWTDPSYRLWVEHGRVGEWTNLKLVPVGHTGEIDRNAFSRAYSVAWNGSRFARGVDLANSADRHPEILESLCGWLEAGKP